MTGMALTPSALPARAVRTGLPVLAGSLVGGAAGVLLALVLATQLFGYRVLAVQSDSMAPAYHRGDLIAVRPIDPGNVERGDVIVFRVAGDVLIVHRVVGIDRATLNLVDSQSGRTTTATQYEFKTKGDANRTVDGMAVEGSAVIGTPWLRVPALGLVADRLPLQGILLAVAGLTAAAWVAWELRSRSGPGKAEGSECP